MVRCAVVLLLSASPVASGLRRYSSKEQEQMRSDDAGVIPANDTTGRGCTCLTQCGGSLAKNHKCDWCKVDKKACSSSYLVTRGHYDFCDLKDDADFVALSASEKMRSLWARTTYNSRSGPKPSLVGTLKVIMGTSMISMFDNVRETMPAGRVKVIHTQGAMLQFDFEVQGNSPYSGMMAPGTHRGLMRLGSATPPDAGMSRCADSDNPLCDVFAQKTFPGIALKFLRSGIHSANTVALRQNGDLSGQINFFEEPLSIHVAPPGFLLKLGKFEQASGCISMTGLSDFCSYSQNGQKASSLNFPYEIKFEAPNPMQFAVNPNATNKGEELLNKLASIPSGTHLYWVIAKATPTSKFERIGKIVTKSASTTSNFGDTQLSFRHQRMEEDFIKHPEWVSQVDQPSCEDSVDKRGSLRPVSDWQCPGAEGVVPL